jgi:tRNA threonylcarbamoyl adenosine modification protein YjeE
VILADDAATAAVGARLADLVRGGDTIALCGDLGAGKTTLVAGLVHALGGSGASSPTFSLVNQYTDTRLIVWHVDLYRIERAGELPELGLDDVIGDPRGIVVVEWADRFPVLPADHLVLALAHLPERREGRELDVTGTGTRGGALAAELLASLR